MSPTEALDEVPRLRRQVRRLRQRIKTALDKIPPKGGRGLIDEEETRHWYSRVSERTVSEVEAVLRGRR